MIEGIPLGDEPVVTNDPNMIFGGHGETIEAGLEPTSQAAIRVSNPGQQAASKMGPAVHQSGGPALPTGTRDVIVRSANGSPEQQGVPVGSVYGLQGEGEEANGGMPMWLKLVLAGGIAYVAARQLGWIK